jgi:mannosyl-oligosaccharide alpha-1,2-mannosidase
VGVFETNIRIVGGLLGGYTLSKDKILLEKAKEMVDLLLPAFESKSGIPFTEINLKTNQVRNRDWHKHESLLSEVGTLQLEFQYLSQLLKDEKYKNIVNRITEKLRVENKKSLIPGLYPCYLRTQGTFYSFHLQRGNIHKNSHFIWSIRFYFLSFKL